ncbi:MAG: CPBP family intramembrane metalloprotease [Deltaproteobacteria bacterium]|nr:CPBP family intramembrane metalloprotease [Deltaproteobacteria bacterium]
MRARAALGDLGVVVRFELLQHLRDPATIVLMLLVPLLVYPLAGWAGHRALSNMEADAEARVFDVAVEPAVPLPANLSSKPLDPSATVVASGQVDAAARVRDGRVELWWDSRSPDSADARSRLKAAITEHRRSEAALRVTVRDEESERDAARSRAARFAPLLLLFTLLSGALYTALDVVTGERERGTLETLMVSTRTRAIVAAAKFLVVTAFSLVSAGVSLGLGAASLAVLGGLRLAAGEVVGTALLLVPLAILVAAMVTLAAACAPDFKSGQVLALPVMFVPLLPASVAALPGFPLTPFTALLPLGGASLAIRAVLDGTASWPLVSLALGSTTAYAVAGVWATARLLGRESVLLAARGPGERRARGDFRVEALITFALAALALWFLGQAAQSRHMLGGLAFTQVGLFLPLALLAPWWLGLPVRERLQLHWPPWTELARGLVVGLCLPGLALTVGQLQGLVLDAPSGLLAGLLEPTTPIWWSLLCLAVLPAICEELLFRGAFLGLWRRPPGRWQAVLATALAFGAMHASIFRLAPTAALGVVLGALALRSRSVVPGIAAHGLNNGIAVLGGYGFLSLEPGPVAWTGAAAALVLGLRRA